MTHIPRSSRQRKRWGAKCSRVIRAIVGNFMFMFVLAGAMLFAIAAVVIASHNLPTIAASGDGSNYSNSGTVDHPRIGNGPSKVTCGAPGLAACPSTVRWIALRSETPGDLIAAARKSTLFTVDRSGNGDYVKDISHLGTPQLVRALHAAGKATAPDFYVIPIHDSNGATMAAAELELNQAHTAIVVTAIITYTHPHPNNTITRVEQQAALNAVQSQHHTALRGGAQPRLVYIPVDGVAQQTGKITWTSGGEFPADPLWLVPGADGKDHVVGADGHAFLVSELPISG